MEIITDKKFIHLTIFNTEYLFIPCFFITFAAENV
jgi:hypothetical protein